MYQHKSNSLLCCSLPGRTQGVSVWSWGTSLRGTRCLLPLASLPPLHLFCVGQAFPEPQSFWWLPMWRYRNTQLATAPPWPANSTRGGPAFLSPPTPPSPPAGLSDLRLGNFPRGWPQLSQPLSCSLRFRAPVPTSPVIHTTQEKEPLVGPSVTLSTSGRWNRGPAQTRLAMG